MNAILYFLISLIATTIGVISGMGGGSIMKPLFDMLGKYSAFDIGIMTSVTTLAMSAVTVILSVAKKNKEEDQRSENKGTHILFFLVIGSIFGGLLGAIIFGKMTEYVTDYVVKITQNCILILIIIIILLYMKSKNDQFSFNSNKKYIAVITGLILGMISSFLGIGGGPLNVALIILIFGFEMKTAVFFSIFIILFAQATKLILSIIQGGFGIFNIDSIFCVVFAGVVGALLGRLISSKASEKDVKKIFNCTQVIIVLTCVYNITKYAVSLYW